MSQQEIVFMVLFSLIAVIIIAFLLHRYERLEKQRNNQLFIGRSHSIKILKLYHFLKENSFSGTYVRRIALRYEMLFPSMEYLVAKKTVFSVCGLCGLNIVVFTLLYFIRPTTINFLTAVLIVYVLQVSVMSTRLRQLEMKMLGQLDESLSDMKHYYIAGRNIGNALWNTMESEKKEIKAHLEEIFGIIDRTDMYEAAREYNETSKNKFLKLLLGICTKTAEQGDSVNEKGDSVFTENINILKRDIRREVEKNRKTNFIFSGLTFVAVAPILSLTAIKNWAVGNLVDLNRFYMGQTGFYCAVAAFLLTIVTFQLLERLRGGEELYRKNYDLLSRIAGIPVIRQILNRKIGGSRLKTLKRQEELKRLGEGYPYSVLVLRKLMYGLAGFLFCMFIIVSGHGAEKNMILTDTVLLYEALPQNFQRNLEKEELSDWIKELGIEQFVDRIKEAGMISEASLEKLITIVEEKELQIEGNYIKWYEFLTALLFSGICYAYPSLMLWFKKQFLEDNMVEEVICFQTILSMQIYVRGTSLIDMLESMELFAKVFKHSIQNCINNMLYNEKEALHELRESEKFPPFQRLIDCFIISDQTDIPTAFDEVIDDIKHFQDVYALDLEMILKRKSDAAELIAFIPGMFILIGYLILPFIGLGMDMFQSSFQNNIIDTF